MTEELKNEDILRKFFDERPKLAGYTFASTRDYHATEDILQEVAISVIKNADQYDSSRPFSYWVRAITRNQIATWFRDKKKGTLSIDPESLDAYSSEIDEIFSSENILRREKALEKCVKKLPKKQRNVMNMRYKSRSSCEEISATMKCSIQSVYSLLKRIKSALRQCVEKQLVREQT